MKKLIILLFCLLSLGAFAQHQPCRWTIMAGPTNGGWASISVLHTNGVWQDLSDCQQHNTDWGDKIYGDLGRCAYNGSQGYVLLFKWTWLASEGGGDWTLLGDNNPQNFPIDINCNQITIIVTTDYYNCSGSLTLFQENCPCQP